MGKIGLENCQFFGHHGYYAKEKEKGNTFEVNVEVEYNFSEAAEKDDLRQGLNYEKLYEEVKSVMLGPSVNLLEHLAQQIIEHIKNKFKGIRAVKVKVAKLRPPIEGDIKSVWVEIEA
ncbi:MAG: dihydroneopterin aldolase [Chitinophagales bacterium]